MGRIRVTRNSTTNYATTADIVAGSNVTITEAVTGDVMTLTIAASGGGGGGTPATTVVTETSYGQTSAVGTSTDYARADHSHGTPPAIAPGATVVAETAYGQTSTAGVSAAFARADHSHGTPAIPSHSALSSLGWTSSGHTGTSQSVAVFNGGGSAAVSTPTADGQVLSRQGGVLMWVTLATGFAIFPEITDVRVDVEPIVSLGLTFTPSAGTL
jgi:hypothetical protein